MDAILSPRRRSLVLGLSALALGGCGRAPDTAETPRYLHFDGTTMGSTYNVRLRAPGSDAARLRAVVQAALDDVDDRMSMFQPQSELSTLNRAAQGTPVALSDELYGVLSAACEVSRWSDGAFDVTVAPLVEQLGLWHTGVASCARAGRSGSGAPPGGLAQSCARRVSSHRRQAACWSAGGPWRYCQGVRCGSRGRGA